MSIMDTAVIVLGLCMRSRFVMFIVSDFLSLSFNLFESSYQWRISLVVTKHWTFLGSKAVYVY